MDWKSSGLGHVRLLDGVGTSKVIEICDTWAPLFDDDLHSLCAMLVAEGYGPKEPAKPKEKTA